MNTLRRQAVTVLAVGVLSACAPSEPAPAATDTTADLAAIARTRSGFQEAMNAGDVAKIGALYTADAIDMPANEPTAKGNAAIVAATEARFKVMKPASVSVTAVDTHIMGDMAVEHGTYHMALTPAAGGNTTMVDGRYIVVLHRQADGSWKVSLSMDNTPAPMAMPPM
jgi:uncharacterized protein (TIGR02246 family)